MSFPGLIRPLRLDDMVAVKSVIEACDLFPCEMLDVMTGPYLNGDATQDQWLTYDDGSPVAVAYYAPERMTDGTWNLLLIAVHPHRQGQGYGAAIVRHVEQDLTVRRQRQLLVETSALPEFERTRRFYEGQGYNEEARLRDYYQAGEDKIVFRKLLSTAT